MMPLNQTGFFGVVLFGSSNIAPMEVKQRSFNGSFCFGRSRIYLCTGVEATLVYQTGPKYQTRLWVGNSASESHWYLTLSYGQLPELSWQNDAVGNDPLVINLSHEEPHRKFTKLSVFSLPLSSKNDTSVVWCHATTNKEPKGETQSSHKKWGKTVRAWSPELLSEIGCQQLRCNILSELLEPNYYQYYS